MSGVRNVARAAAQRVYARWRRLPLSEEVLLESYEGSAPACNPAAIAAYLLDHTQLPLVWALREPMDFGDPRVRGVRYRSAAYYRALATSKYLVNNVTFPPLFDKREDQVYLNTWHGTPLKKMGRDVDGPHRWIANTVANFEAADILLSSGEYMTRTMYAGAYGVSTDNVVELGSPRVDVQFAPHPAPDVVLYAPTWQEASHTEAVDDLADVGTRMRAIAESVPAGLRPMVRVHGKLGEKARSDPGIASFLVPDDVSTNALIARTHTLITDHSSIAFDYLATGSRTLFFTPVAYPRGVYLTDAELPGPRTGSLRELQSWLTGAAPVAGTPPEVARARFCAHEDGHATQRVVGRLLGTTFT